MRHQPFDLDTDPYARTVDVVDAIGECDSLLTEVARALGEPPCDLVRRLMAAGLEAGDE